jgi:NLR family CARD domain-containing protein 3
VPFLVTAFHELCHGNKYTTTQHAINSAVLKLSKLTVVGNVYRGISGGRLPPQFFSSDEYGVRGGVEYGFMSTTADRSVATGYAGDGAATVIEMRMGFADRGADISWLSQYPHEAECLFAPLCALEVQGTRVDGALLVVTVRPCVNSNAMTISEVPGAHRCVKAFLPCQAPEREDTRQPL